MSTGAASGIAVAGLPPTPPPGSIRYFVLLYCPRERRASLAALLAIADELASGLDRHLDHAVAHLRLQWWQLEAERLEQGQAQHPWLRSLSHADALSIELGTLVAAAATDLATQSLSGQVGVELHRMLFESAAAVLVGPALSAPQRQRMGQLGMAALALPSQSATDSASRASALQPQLAPLAEALQPAVTPLLVWCALLLRAHRRPDRAGSRMDAFAESFAAWRAARSAARGRFNRN